MSAIPLQISGMAVQSEFRKQRTLNVLPSEDVAVIYDRRAGAVDMVAQHSQLIDRKERHHAFLGNLGNDR